MSNVYFVVTYKERRGSSTPPIGPNNLEQRLRIEGTQEEAVETAERAASEHNVVLLVRQAPQGRRVSNIAWWLRGERQRSRGLYSPKTMAWLLGL